MLKFFEKGEELPDKDWERNKNQKCDHVTSLYDHNFGNHILQCVCRQKQNQNVYIH